MVAVCEGERARAAGDTDAQADQGNIQRARKPPTLVRFLRFGVVGGSGVFLDMAMFFMLADARTLHLNVSLAKTLAAETAIVSNFTWNDLWTFRDIAAGHVGWRARGGRFLRFNLICLAGIALNVLLLNVQIRFFGANMYLANFTAIFLVSIWNFIMNLRFGWKA